MEVVHVVMANWDYEGGAAVRVFADAYEAGECARACREYEATRPQYPDDEDAIQAWADGLKKWEAAHPAGERTGADHYTVVEVPFGAAPAHPGEQKASAG